MYKTAASYHRFITQASVRQYIMLVTPTFLAGAVSITVFFPTFGRVHSTCHRGRSRRYYTFATPRRVGAQQKDKQHRADLSCELKNRTVINNRFLPAPVCAAPGKASTQGEIFFVEALQERSTAVKMSVIKMSR